MTFLSSVPSISPCFTEESAQSTCTPETRKPLPGWGSALYAPNVSTRRRLIYRMPAHEIPVYITGCRYRSQIKKKAIIERGLPIIEYNNTEQNLHPLFVLCNSPLLKRSLGSIPLGKNYVRNSFCRTRMECVRARKGSITTQISLGNQ